MAICRFVRIFVFNLVLVSVLPATVLNIQSCVGLDSLAAQYLIWPRCCSKLNPAWSIYTPCTCCHYSSIHTAKVAVSSISDSCPMPFDACSSIDQSCMLACSTVPWHTLHLSLPQQHAGSGWCRELELCLIPYAFRCISHNTIIRGTITECQYGLPMLTVHSDCQAYNCQAPSDSDTPGRL